MEEGEGGGGVMFGREVLELYVGGAFNAATPHVAAVDKHLALRWGVTNLGGRLKF